MKLLFEFLPILFFFLTYKFYDIYAATLVAIVSTFAQVGVVWWQTRKLAKMQLATLAIIVIFGGLTLILRDETFIKWKPTVVNWLFALSFLFTQFFSERTAIAYLLGSAMTLPVRVWRRLNIIWVFFFFIIGCANLYVMTYFDSDTWVNFKLFGMLGLTIAFIIIQTIFLGRYLNETPDKPQLPREGTQD